MSGERPPKLVGWTREQWDRLLAKDGGKESVARILQESPCGSPPHLQQWFARTLVSWMHYEGPLPPPAPTPRQQKRAKAWAKKHQQRVADAGSEEGAMGRDFEETPDNKMNAPPRCPHNPVRRPPHFDDN